jgi:putative intracellular protease/amidase
MKPIIVAATWTIVLALPTARFAAGAPAAAVAKHYVCAPCGLPCDHKVFDHPGTCPACGMPLVDQATAAAAAAAHPHKRVAILLFNGVEIIDYTGPYEVFGAADFEVFTVAESREPITTAMGMTVVPRYTFADAPPAEVLVVPGGGVRGARGSATTLRYVREQTARGEHTLSVCNGAFILASAGLLDGLVATTTAGLIDDLHTEFPKVKVVYDQRFVDNGKIITAAGLSSGIDGALHVVSKMIGQGNAQAVALGIEYDWRPATGFARAALADRLIPRIDLDAVGHWDYISTQGGTDHWEIVLRGTSDLGPAPLMEHIARDLTAHAKWTRAATPTGAPATGSQFRLAGHDGRPWRATLVLLPPAGATRTYTLRLTLARAD